MVCLQVKRNDEMSDQPKISILANSPVSSHPDHCLSLSIKSYDLKKKTMNSIRASFTLCLQNTTFILNDSLIHYPIPKN